MESHPKLKAAIARYDTLLQETSAALTEARDFLAARSAEEKMIFGGRPLSPYLRPHFVTAERWRYLCQECARIWECVEMVGQAALTDRRMYDDLGITDGEARLIEIDPGYAGISITSRLDSFLTEDAFSFVELNAENPAGISYCEVMARIFMELPVMQRFTKEYPVTPLYARRLLLDTLLTAYREWSGGSAKPRIAIVDWEGLPTQCEFEQFQAYFQAEGFECIIAPPEKLDYRDGKLRQGDFKIDLVYRRVLTNDILDRPDECKALVNAYRDRAACVVNGFRTKLVHKKMFFGVLTDERYAPLFTPEQRAAIQAHIPWTRRLADGRTTYAGESVDLLNFLRANQSRLVIKPNDEYGGKGVVVGWEASASEWEAAIADGLRNDCLVQEKVPTAHEAFPHFGPEGDIAFIEQLVDLDPLLFHGKVGGAFTRLSSTALCNVTSGGGMVPTFVLED